MAHSIEYNSEANIIESQYQGEIELNELLEGTREIMQLIKQTNCFNILTDLSNATLNASVLDLYDHPQQLVQVIEEAGIQFYKLKRAFVSKESGERFIFYEDVAVNRGHNVKQFQKIEEARRWLQQN